MIEVISLTTVTAVQRQRHLGRDVFIHGPANTNGFYIPGNATMEVECEKVWSTEKDGGDLFVTTHDRTFFIPNGDWYGSLSLRKSN